MKTLGLDDHLLETGGDDIIDAESRFQEGPVSPTFNKDKRASDRKKLILDLLYGNRCVVLFSYEDGAIHLDMNDRDGLYAVLSDTDTDERGSDTPLDAKKRTALFYLLNPTICGRIDNKQRAYIEDPETLEAVMCSAPDPTLQDIEGNTALDGQDEDTVQMVMSYTKLNRKDVWEREGVQQWFQSLLTKESAYACVFEEGE